MKKPINSNSGLFFAVSFILLFCVHSTTPTPTTTSTRDKREVVAVAATPPPPPPPQPTPPLVKRQGAIAHDLAKENKLKISELKPCISKAFCEVNAIADEPTFEASGEFYRILERLGRFSDIAENTPTSSTAVGSAEESAEESSEEESYERVNYPYQQQQPHYYGYRRGRNLSYKIKHKKKAVKKNLLNGTLVDTTAQNRTGEKSKDKKIERRSFVERKTRELDVVDDLTALIKISSEIGQALKSPRRCRDLFQKCTLSYDEIIQIFNQTQQVETAPPPLITPPPVIKPKPKPKAKKPIAKAKPTATKTSTEDRNKNSRHHRFGGSDEDDIEYVTDTEIQPVKTYALFAPQEHHDNRHPEEILVEEAFKKFENTFPVAGVSENLDFLKSGGGGGGGGGKKIDTVSSSEEYSDEENNNSGSKEVRGGYHHRSSEVSERRGKKKKPAVSIAEEDDFEDDSDVAIESTEISKRPEVQVKKKYEQKVRDRESSEESSEDEEEGQRRRPQRVYTREEEEYPKGKRKDVANKRLKPPPPSSGGQKKQPQKEEEMTSSEEEQRDPNNEMNRPPPDSQFYHLLQGMNDGKGADGIPDNKRRKKKKSKNKPSYDEQSDYGGQNDDEYSGGYKGQYQYNQYGAQSDQQSSSDSSPGFFSNIMSWFSSSGSGGSGKEEESYGGYNNEHQRPDSYKISVRFPSSSSSDSSGEYNSGSKRRQQGRGGESEEAASDEDEEEEEEDEDDDLEQEQERRNSEKSVETISKGKKQAPPPPLVIEPEEEQQVQVHETASTKKSSSSKKKPANKTPTNRKKQQEKPLQEQQSEEEQSSEESPPPPPQQQQQPQQKSRTGQIASYETYYTKIFGSAEDIEKKQKQAKRALAAKNKPKKDQLTKTFDTISSSFKTSADKIIDWSEELGEKVNVGSGGVGSGGRYTVSKGSKMQQQQSYEEDEE